jgi:hypothetical protein
MRQEIKLLPTALTPHYQNEKPAQSRQCRLLYLNGGYGWARTTDPSIMSAVL